MLRIRKESSPATFLLRRLRIDSIASLGICVPTLFRDSDHSVIFVLKKRPILFSVAATIALSISAAVFYFNASPKPKRITEAVSSPHAVGSEGFRHAMGVLIGTPILEGNSVEVLAGGEAIYASMLEDISAAESTITLESYEFWGGKVSKAFADALSERAEAGISVHVILDYIGSYQADRSVFRQMEEAGVELVLWREPSWYRSSRFNHRTHRKLLVVDGRIGYTGGANLADAWLESETEHPYHDYHFRFTGPIVSYLQAAFLDNWIASQGSLLIEDIYIGQPDQTGSVAAQVVISSPREGQKHIRTSFLFAIASAREHIRILSAFFYVDPEVEQALIDAVERGVRVDVVVPGEKVSEPWVRFASRNRWGNLLKGGVRIHEYQPSRLHAKAMIIDYDWVTIGSANFHNRSFRLNDEANVFIYDPDFTASMIAIFERNLEQTVEYDYAQWQERPFTEWFRGALGNLIGAHL